MAFGSPLKCRSGAEPDQPAVSLYQAPRTIAFQWRRNTTPIAGQTTPKLPLTHSGSYSCRATATNHAGAVTRTSSTMKISAHARIASCPYKGTRIRATLDDDQLRGGRRSDIISGRGGSDLLEGAGGNDCLSGQGGDDVLAGGPGNDVLRDTDGEDRLIGGPGNDRLNSRDRTSRYRDEFDDVDCGSGVDTAIVDRADRVRRNCEHVRRR